MAAPATKEAALLGPGRWFGQHRGTSLGKLPRFADAMADVARGLAANLGVLSASPVEVMFKAIATDRVETVLERRRAPVAFAMAHAEGWNTPIAFLFDQAVVAVAVQALFGGGEDDFEVPERTSFSAVEGRIAQVLAEQCGDAIAKGFANVLPTGVAVEPIGGKPDPSRLGKPAAAVTVVTFALRSLGPAVDLDLLIPQSALDGFSQDFAAVEDAVAVVADPGWSEKLGCEVSRARMKLQARLDLPQMTLRDIARLTVGQILPFAPDAGGAALLSSGGTDLFRCALGQSEGRYSLRIADDVNVPGPSPHKTSAP